MKITPVKKAKKPAFPPANPTPSELGTMQHLGGVCYPIVDDDFKCEVVKWLNARRKNEEWLAEQCQVTKRTVARWLEPWTNIPAARKGKLRELMKQFPAHRH